MKGFSIHPLAKSYDRKSFCCGISSLDVYLHRHARQDSCKRIAVTYILHDELTQKVAGYYTLSAATIELKTLPKNLREKLPAYSHIPATLIGRLAIDVNYKQRGLGEVTLIDALKRAYRTSLSVASFAVVVDAINHHAETFYEKYGFLKLSNKKSRLFLPMKVVSNLM